MKLENKKRGVFSSALQNWHREDHIRSIPVIERDVDSPFLRFIFVNELKNRIKVFRRQPIWTYANLWDHSLWHFRDDLAPRRVRQLAIFHLDDPSGL
jgi:hypothetical protein